MHKKHLVGGLLLAVSLGITLVNGGQAVQANMLSRQVLTSARKRSRRPYTDPVDMRAQVGAYWRRSSEQKAYPDLKKIKNLNLRASILGNRLYVRSGKKVIYTMYCSAGKMIKGRSLTPTGTYFTDYYRPERFAAALYPVGWIGQLYLLHSVPTYSWSNRFIIKEAKKLGKKPGSHGCLRLSVCDAKWLHDHLPVHAKLIIKYR